MFFEEFEEKIRQAVFVSATPGPYEKQESSSTVEQLIRPTGLVDPEIEIRPIEHQVDDLLGEVKARAARNERSLVTTLTRKMAEDLTDYLADNGVRVRYLHYNIDLCNPYPLSPPTLIVIFYLFSFSLNAFASFTPGTIQRV